VNAVPHQLSPSAKILLVDDELLVLWALQDALEQMGFTSFESAGGIQESITLIHKHAFDFAFVDVNLRGVKSFEIAEFLQERDIPFVFVTGYGRAGLDGQFEDIDVLTKPVSQTELRQTLRVVP
jgi:CheY-like chemotaxis protein